MQIVCLMTHPRPLPPNSPPTSNNRNTSSLDKLISSETHWGSKALATWRMCIRSQQGMHSSSMRSLPGLTSLAKCHICKPWSPSPRATSPTLTCRLSVHNKHNNRVSCNLAITTHMPITTKYPNHCSLCPLDRIILLLPKSTAFRTSHTQQACR